MYCKLQQKYVNNGTLLVAMTTIVLAMTTVDWLMLLVAMTTVVLVNVIGSHTSANTVICSHGNSSTGEFCW